MHEMIILKSKVKRAKVYSLNSHGQLKTDQGGFTKYHQAQEVMINDLTDIENTLNTLQDDPYSFIIRGRVTQTGEEASKDFRLQRNMESKHILDVPLSWICIDTDDITWPMNPDGSMHSKDQAIDHVIHSLPTQFHQVSFVYQWSNSALIKKDEGKYKIKLHLYFMLNQALKTSELKRWFTDLDQNPFIDKSLYNGFQPITTAKPILHGVNDPFQHDRIGMIEKNQEAVHTPSRQSLKPPKKKLYQPRSFDGIDLQAQNSFDKHISILSQTSTDRFAAAKSKARYLGGLVGAGRLRESEVKDALYSACEVNGTVKKRGQRSVWRLIDKMIQIGKQNPIIREESTPFFKINPVQDDYKPSSDFEINQRTKEVIIKAIDLASTENLIVIDVMTGAGKSHHTLEQMSYMDEAVFLGSNHKIIDEQKTSFEKQHPGKHVQKLEGKVRRCQLYQDACDVEKTEYDIMLESTYMPLFCNEVRCDKRRTCPVYLEPKKTLENKITFATHSHLPSLKTNGILSFIDEKPKMTYTRSFNLNDLEKITRSKITFNQDISSNIELASKLTKSQIWINQNPVISKDAQSLKDSLKQWESEQRRKTANGHYPEIKMDQKDLINLPIFKQLKQHASSRIDSLEGFAKHNDDHKINSCIRFIKKIYQWTLQSHDERQALAITWTPNGIHMHFTSKLKLEEDGRFICLDATAKYSKTEWKALAQASNRELIILKADLKAPISHGLWIKNASMQNSRLFDAQDSLSKRSIGSLNAITPKIKEKLLERKLDTQIGIGVHKKKLESLLLDGLQGEGELSQTDFMDVIKPYQHQLGYTGRDDSASNRFQDCDVMMILGSPFINKIHHQITLEALDPSLTQDDINTAYEQHAKGILMQWFGRLRHLRKAGKQIIYVGSLEPPKISGLNWEQHEIKGKTGSLDKISIKYDVMYRFKSYEALSHTQIVHDYEITKRMANIVINELKSETTLHEWKDESSGVGRKRTLFGLYTQDEITSFHMNHMNQWESYSKSNLYGHEGNLLPKCYIYNIKDQAHEEDHGNNNVIHYGNKLQVIENQSDSHHPILSDTSLSMNDVRSLIESMNLHEEKDVIHYGNKSQYIKNKDILIKNGFPVIPLTDLPRQTQFPFMDYQMEEVSA